MSLKIDTTIPGGNVFIENINDFDVVLTKDLRNTEGDWFYWEFKAFFDRIGTYHFRFTNGFACGTRGPAVSYDNGLTWEWLGAESVSGSRRDVFTYHFDGKNGTGVIFCMGMQYVSTQLSAFLIRHATSPYLTPGVLTYTRKNRPVQLLRIEDKLETGAKKHIFLSSRHHSCEMMATYALEGILESALGNDELGHTLRARYIINAVPFADTDGVIDGDQGKNRRPHDHNRDYNERSIYPAVRGIKRLLLDTMPFFMLDLHCPWLFGGGNETIYLPGAKEPKYEKNMQLFSQILESEAPAEAPHFSRDNILYGTSWNTDANYTQGMSSTEWARQNCHPVFANIIEIPYANARDITLYPDAVRALGRAIAVSILKFDDLGLEA